MSLLTKRKLKAKITKLSIVEVLSLLDIQHVKGAVDAKDEDLVETAYLVQHQHERAASKFAQKIKEKRIAPFFNATDCPIPLGSLVEAIQLDDEIICKKLP